MNCRNGETYLREAIESVYKQTWEDWEIVFWDNASTDRTAEIAGAFDNRLRYHRAAVSTPLGEARNLAVNRAKGDLIAFLDADDRWEPEKLARQIPLFDDRLVAVAFTDAEIVDARGRKMFRYSERTELHRGMVLERLFLNSFLILSSVVVRADVLREAGGFPPQFRFSEEYDLFLRIAERWNFDFDEAALTAYRIHGENATWNTTVAHSETRQVLLETLARRPDLRRALGRRLIRYRLSGLPCEADEEAVLRHPFARHVTKAGSRGSRASSARLRTLGLYALTLGGPWAVRQGMNLHYKLKRLRHQSAPTPL
jgi:glycosyltransferase involved in cell wall biosynthesis